MKKNKKRIGKVCINIEYVVEMDNEEMVERAKRCLVEDLMNIAKYDEYEANIDVVEDKKAKESDIPEFLQEDNSEV